MRLFATGGRGSGPGARRARILAVALAALVAAACDGQPAKPPLIRWYVFKEPSGAFAEAAARCSAASGGAYRVDLADLPADADQQREQLVRRLAAGDADLDVLGMDVIWTAEFARAGWILPWPEETAGATTRDRLEGPLASAHYAGRLWALPFTTNAQLLWYRTDRVGTPPVTWDEMLASAEAIGQPGTVQAQGERYEGLTVLFVSLLASAGGAVLDETGRGVSLEEGPTRTALATMRRLATSPAADPALATSREDQARLAFESGKPTFMLNYTFVWPSARANAPAIAANMGWARWPAVVPGLASRVTVGGINLGIGAFSRHPALAREAASCLASMESQRLAAVRGGLPPTTGALYDDPGVRDAFPFADVLRATLRDAVQRPQTPLYSDLSLAITRVLHPMPAIDPARDIGRLREAVGRALRSEGLL